MKKKQYYIEITGESHGYCIRELSKEEAELVQGIFTECDSKYVGGKLVEIPSKEKISNYITAEKLDTYDFKDIQKICDYFNISINVFEAIRFEYSLTHPIIKTE